MGCAPLKGLSVLISQWYQWWGWEMAQWVSVCHVSCEGLSSYTQNPSQDWTLSICNPGTSKGTWEAETGESRKACRLDCLV